MSGGDAVSAGEGSWGLVQASQAGDMAAFGELFDRYHAVVSRFVLARTGDRGLAEDLTQETFCRALRRIGSVSYQGRDIGAWLVTIARNLMLDHRKSSRYRLERLEPAPSPAGIGGWSGGTSVPEQRVLDTAVRGELWGCVRRLDPAQRECVGLRFGQGLSVAETARVMGRNPGAVTSLQHRAVRRLSQLFPEDAAIRGGEVA